jgi:hypothetical protein
MFGQKINDAGLDEVRKYFIEHVLPLEVEKGGKFISVSMPDNEWIGSVNTGGSTLFLRKLSGYLGTSDTAILYGAMRKADNFKPSAGYHFEQMVYLDTPVKNLYDIQMLQIKYKATYLEVSGFVFAPQGDRCIVFIHVVQGAGKSIELIRRNKQWTIAEKRTEWLE